MADLDPLVAEILGSLDETPLGDLAVEGRAAVAILPDFSPDAPQTRLESVGIQLAAVRQSILTPLKVELESLEALPGLARELGLSVQVNLLLPEAEGGFREIELTATRRIEALREVVEVLSHAIDDAGRLAAEGGEDIP
jgi:hypothetical protein